MSTKRNAPMAVGALRGGQMNHIKASHEHHPRNEVIVSYRQFMNEVSL